MWCSWFKNNYLAACIFGMLFVSASANAGSFRDFILADELSTVTQQPVDMLSSTGSAQCMQCHNGSKAKTVPVKHADTSMIFTSHGSSNHPVGMSYASYARKNPAAYIAPANLDSRIKLEQGKVTCISCHQSEQNSTHDKNTVASNEVNTADRCTSTKLLTTGSNQTRLCMTCHAM